MAAPTNNFRRLLSAHRVSEVIRANHQIVVVSTHESPVTAFQRIVAANVLSAPAYDEKTHSYAGFLDVRDLVQFVTFRAEEKHKDEQRAAGTLAPPPVDMRSIFDSAARMYSRPLDGISVHYMAVRNRFVPVHPDDTLLRVAELLSQHDLHRVPVLGPDNKILDIVSQSTLISFIYQHRDELKDALSATIKDTRIGSTPVFAVRSNATALDAFKIMAKYNRSGIAIVDEEGRFISNTSGSDLKLFIQDPDRNAQVLQSSIIDFLSAIRRAEVTERDRSPTIAVRPVDSVEKVLGKLHATRVHRVFVASDDEHFRPEIVISLTDLLVYLLNHGMPNAITVDRS